MALHDFLSRQVRAVVEGNYKLNQSPALEIYGAAGVPCTNITAVKPSDLNSRSK